MDSCETWVICGYVHGVAYYWTEDSWWTRDINNALLHSPYDDGDMVLYKAKLLASIPKDRRISKMTVIPGPEIGFVEVIKG